MDPLISVPELHAALANRGDIRLLDVRWTLGGPPGLPEYREAHIPGAVYVSLDEDLAGPAEAREGRHPLPPVEAFQAAARRWGVRTSDTVIVYDDASGLAASRAWWLLRYAGFECVAVVDGGLRAWQAAGLELARGDEANPPGDVVLAYGGAEVLDQDAAAALPETGVLLDARAPERYRGESEPFDPRAGHIPGALNSPLAANLTADGRFREPDELREHFATLGIDSSTKVGVYCGSGITAAHDALSLTIAGLPMPALYPGSWSQWSNHPERPVATGADPR